MVAQLDGTTLSTSPVMTVDEVTVMLEIEMGRDDDDNDSDEKCKAKRSANARQNRTARKPSFRRATFFLCLL